MRGKRQVFSGIAWTLVVVFTTQICWGAENRTGSTPKRTSSVQADADPDEEPEEEEEEEEEEERKRPAFVYFGFGAAAFGLHHGGGGPRYDEGGVALQLGGRHAVHDKIALNFGVTWGLTTWTRTEVAWGAAQSIGRWTKNAYIDVTQWVGNGNEDDRALRGFAAFFAYFGLLFPYFVSGVLYVAGPFFATSSLDFNIAGSFHLMETKKGPYFETGASLFAYLHPSYGDLRGGVGPSLGIGYDLGHIGFVLRGMYSPRLLHGEATDTRSDIYTGTLLMRIQ